MELWERRIRRCPISPSSARRSVGRSRRFPSSSTRSRRGLLARPRRASDRDGRAASGRSAACGGSFPPARSPMSSSAHDGRRCSCRSRPPMHRSAQPRRPRRSPIAPSTEPQPPLPMFAPRRSTSGRCSRPRCSSASAPRALDMARRRTSRQRHQFGVPIGSFQAVQHALADLPGLIDGARLLAHKAAWAVDGGGDGHLDVDDNDITDFARSGRRWRSCSPPTSRRTPPTEPALPRRLRLRRGVRHPALLPPGPRLGARLDDPGRRAPARSPTRCSARPAAAR